MRLLLVEDTQDVAEAIVASFSLRGDAVDHASSVAEALAAVTVQDYEAAILDISLPDGSGVEVLRALRATGKPTLVLMLSALGDIDNRVSALDGGADDYVVKPFDLRELHARVRALARRRQPTHDAAIAFEDIVIDPASCGLKVGGVPVVLTRREYSLLEIMMASRGRVVSKDRIFDQMFSFKEEEVGINAVETYVARLRRKLAGSRVAIRTLRGLGYQLVAEQ
jgi:two-component system response regulator TctD